MALRHRSRGAKTLSSPLVVDFIKGGTDSSTGNYVMSALSESMTDVVVPGYSRLVAKGHIFNNPCLYEKSEHKTLGSGVGHYRQNAGSPEYYLYGPLSANRGGEGFLNKVAPVIDDEGLARRAKLIALSNIDSTPYSFGEDIGELKETLSLLRDPLRGLKDIIDHARARGKDLRPDKVIGGAASAYLEYRFAITPLIRSVHDVLEAYASKERKPPDRRTAHGRTNDSGVISNTYVQGSTMWTRWDLSWSYQRDYHASILYEVSNPVYDASWRYGLRAKDLPTTIWQLLPYSFMVDRLWDVSSLSKAAINLTDPKVKILCASLRMKAGDERSYELIGEGNAGWTIEVLGERHILKNFVYRRDPWFPTLRDAVPAVRPNNLFSSAQSIADITALLLSRLM